MWRAAAQGASAADGGAGAEGQSVGFAGGDGFAGHCLRKIRRPADTNGVENVVHGAPPGCVWMVFEENWSLSRSLPLFKYCAESIAERIRIVNIPKYSKQKMPYIKRYISKMNFIK